MTFDEDDLRLGLRALTYAPPPAPPERAAASTRRWRWIKTRRVAVAAVTAFAVAVPVVALVRQPSGGVARPAALAGWPDRRDPAVRRIAQGILEVTRDDSNVPTGSTPYWLYAGRVPGTEDTVVAVWAWCVETGCPAAVLAYGHLSGPQRWTVESGQLPQPSGAPFGWYLQGTGGETVLFALGPASADTLTWDGHEVRGRNGVFTARLGYLDHAPDVVMRHGDQVLYHGTLAVGADMRAVPYTRPAPPVTTVPAGYRIVTSRQGQGARVDGAEQVGARVDAPAGRPFRIYARCVGKGRLFVLWGGEEPPVPCDGAVHASPEYTATSAPIFLASTDDPFAAWYWVAAERT